MRPFDIALLVPNVLFLAYLFLNIRSTIKKLAGNLALFKILYVVVSNIWSVSCVQPKNKKQRKNTVMGRGDGWVGCLTHIYASSTSHSTCVCCHGNDLFCLLVHLSPDVLHSFHRNYLCCDFNDHFSRYTCSQGNNITKEH